MFSLLTDYSSELNTAGHYQQHPIFHFFLSQQSWILYSLEIMKCLFTHQNCQKCLWLNYSTNCSVCVCTPVEWLYCLLHLIQIWYKLTSICVGKLQSPVQTQPIHEQENSSAGRSSFVNQSRTCSHQQFNNLTSQKKMICTSISFIYTKFVSS